MIKYTYLDKSRVVSLTSVEHSIRSLISLSEANNSSTFGMFQTPSNDFRLHEATFRTFKLSSLKAKSLYRNNFVFNYIFISSIYYCRNNLNDGRKLSVKSSSTKFGTYVPNIHKRFTDIGACNLSEVI